MMRRLRLARVIPAAIHAVKFGRPNGFAPTSANGLHSTAKTESSALLLGGGLAVGAAALAARYGLEAYNR